MTADLADYKLAQRLLQQIPSAMPDFETADLRDGLAPAVLIDWDDLRAHWLAEGADSPLAARLCAAWIAFHAARHVVSDRHGAEEARSELRGFEGPGPRICVYHNAS